MKTNSPEEILWKKSKYPHHNPGTATSPEEDSSVDRHGEKKDRKDVHVALGEAH